MGGRPNRGDAWGGVGIAWVIVSTIIAGMLVWGGVGYLVDRWLDTDRVFMGIGVVLGGAAGIYQVYLRYGRGDGARS